MADWYFHYTSYVAAQMIRAAGWIQGSSSRVVYLTDELYLTNGDAANILGIPIAGPAIGTQAGVVHLTKPVEIVCCIPAPRLLASLLKGPRPAKPFWDNSTGAVIYRGQGREFTYSGPIPVAGLPWINPVRP